MEDGNMTWSMCSAYITKVLRPIHLVERWRDLIYCLGCFCIFSMKGDYVTLCLLNPFDAKWSIEKKASIIKTLWNSFLIVLQSIFSFDESLESSRKSVWFFRFLTFAKGLIYVKRMWRRRSPEENNVQKLGFCE